MSKRSTHVVALVALAVLTAACVGNRMHWPEQSVVEGDGYVLAFVEFDEQGELWAPSQVTAALDRIERANGNPDGAVVVVFVHGWNHNAAANDANVVGFRQQLARIVEDERGRQWGEPREVVGIYVGWRGKVSKLMPLNMLSFYGRRAAAERIASLATTETIYRVLTGAKQNPRTRVLLIGHSFGGMILETALSQALVGFILQNKDRDEIDFPADLVILLNPAAQSIQAKQFVEILARHRLRLYRTDEDDTIRLERPLIVSMTSSGDWATGIAFPLGLGLKSLNKGFRSYGSEYCNAVTSQRKYFRRTPGHNRVLLSHRVLAEPLETARERPIRTEEMAAGLEIPYDPLTRVQSFVLTGTTKRFTIQRRPGAFNDTPYWIMRVPTSVMPDHGHIFGADLQELIRALIVVTGTLSPDARTVMVRENGVRPLGLARDPQVANGLLFLDRSRRIYSVSRDRETAFYACIPAEAAAVERSLGYAQMGRSMMLARSMTDEPVGGAWPIDVLRMRLLDNDTFIEGHVRIEAGAPPAAVSFDMAGRRAFVASRDSPTIGVASLDKKRTVVVPLTTVGGLRAVTQLLYEPDGDQLFVSDGVSTVVHLVLGEQEIRTEVMATDLSSPTAMAFDAERRRLYVATRGRKVWQMSCEGTRCGAKTLFASAETLISPTSLLVTEEGILWVGDPEAQTLLCFSPNGRLIASHNKLPRL